MADSPLREARSYQPRLSFPCVHRTPRELLGQFNNRVCDLQLWCKTTSFLPCAHGASFAAPSSSQRSINLPAASLASSFEGERTAATAVSITQRTCMSAEGLEAMRCKGKRRRLQLTSPCWARQVDDGREETKRTHYRHFGREWRGSGDGQEEEPQLHGVRSTLPADPHGGPRFGWSGGSRGGVDGTRSPHSIGRGESQGRVY